MREARDIPVCNDEFAVLKAADHIMRRNDEPSEQGLVNPLVFDRELSPAERAIVDARLQIELHHRKAIGDYTSEFHFSLEKPQAQVEMPCEIVPLPLCNPAADISPIDAARREVGPSPYDLAQLLLDRVCLRRYRGEVYHFNGKIYRALSADELKTLIMDFLEKEISISGAPGQLHGTATFIKADPQLEAEPITDPCLVCFRNGVLDLRTWTLTPPTPENFFTSCVEADFHLGVTEVCPNFDRFLAESMGGDPMLIQRVWEAIGYLLTTDMAAKVFIVLQGIGDSGKSVLGNLISSLFNQEAVSNLDIFRFRDRFSTSALVGKRLNISMDLPNNQLSQEAVGTIKMLTGRDAITVEPKFKASYPYRSLCKLVFGTNHTIRLQAPDEAFENRLLLIPFRYSVPKERQDRDLLWRLEGEKTAIAVRALHTYVNLARNGYQFSGGILPAVDTGNRVAVVDVETIVNNFLTQCCEFGPEKFSATSELFNACRCFCTEFALPVITDTVQFSKILHNLCGEMVHPKKKRVDGQPLNGYEGIALQKT